VISLTAGSTTVPVCLPSADQQRTFARLFADGGVSELTDPHDAFAGYAHDWPTPLAPRWVAPHLGRMHWPIVGASRYAHAVYLLHEADWFALAAEVETGATVTVSFEDGASAGETARTVGMKFLSAKPLVRLNEGQPVAADDEAGDAWFVVLVDQRYFAAREAIAGTGEASDGSGSSTAGNGGSARTFFSWSALFAALGVTVADAVDAAYGTPDRSRWTEARMRGRSAAVLADVAASLVGSRIVTVPGGSASLQRPTLARATALDTSVSTQADRIVWGGPIEAEASATECPDTVRAVFRAPSDSRVETLDSAATGYTAWPGNGPMSAALDPAVHETAATKQAVVDQWADDFCAWRFGMFAVTFAGVPTFPTSGFCWAVTIESKRDELLTRWERPPVMHGWLGRASVSAATNDQPAYPTRENGTETNGCDIPTGSGGDAVGLAWYSRYLHLGGVEVQAGQTLNPGQRIGVLMRNPPGTVAHLHHAVTDGGDPFLWPETDFPIAGVSLPIDDWLGFPVLGARGGLPNPRATRFDATQLAAIEARYRPPVEPNDRWRTFVSSAMHTLYDYYAVDLAFSDSTDAQEVAGAPVFAAVGGNDVLTEVMWTGFRGSAGWGVLLRHRLCGAPDAGDEGDGMGALPPNGQWGDGGDFGADPHEIGRGGLLEVVTRVCIGPITAGTLIGRDTEAGNGPMQEICVDPATLAIINGVLTVTCCDGGGGGITQLTGDVTAGPGSGSQAATLSSTGVSAGTYTSVTVDVKGRVTAGTNPTTLSGYGITDAQPLDADLTALAALTGTDTIYYRSAADTWSAVTIGSGLSFSGGTLASTVTGTVTSVNLTAPAAGITVSGGPITTSGSITLALADDLAALEALSGTNTIYYRSAANTWSAVTIGSGLSFSGGTLAATGGTGTVTSVNLTAPAAGITVSGGPVTTSGSITLALADDLAALEALSGTNTIYYRSAANTWSAVTIGTGLTFSGGALAPNLRGYIDGLVLSYSSTTAVAVSAGVCADSTNAYLLSLSSFTKTLQTSGAWTAGTGNNGLDTGARANNTWYHVYVIASATGGSVDVLFSLSATAPTMPSGYTLFRRIGSIKTGASTIDNNWVQYGDFFHWLVPVDDVSALNPGTAAVTRTLSTPTGVRTRALVSVGFDASATGDNPSAIYLSDLNQTDSAPTVAINTCVGYSPTVYIANIYGRAEIWTNTSSQIRSRLQLSATNTRLRIQTHGWFDPRGRNA